jgi:hypothetical protein
LIVFFGLLSWLLILIIRVAYEDSPDAPRRHDVPVSQRRPSLLDDSGEDDPLGAPRRPRRSTPYTGEDDPLGAPRRPRRSSHGEPSLSKEVALSAVVSQQTKRDMWAYDPRFKCPPQDQGLPVPLENLLAMMLEGRRLVRRPFTYGLDEWLLLPLRPDLDGAMQVRIADAERAARHPDVLDASQSFNPSGGNSYLHRDTVPMLIIWARYQAPAAEERRRRQQEGQW